MFKCKCGKSHTRLPRDENQKHGVKRGMQYVIMFDCSCGRTIGIEGTKGVKPPKVMR